MYAYEHFYFGWGLFESDLLLKSLFYLTKPLESAQHEEQFLGQPFQYPNREIPSLTLVAMWQCRVIANRKYSTWQKIDFFTKALEQYQLSVTTGDNPVPSSHTELRMYNIRSCNSHSLRHHIVRYNIALQPCKSRYTHYF